MGLLKSGFAIVKGRMPQGRYRGLNQLLQSIATATPPWPQENEFSLVSVPEDQRPKVLLVVAHPDDESECAAILYRITHELGGVVDQAVVTDGEAGAQYSAPAQAYYRMSLGEGPAGRRRLAHVRRKEVLRASKILGIRHNYFFNQKDTGFTCDPYDGFHAWNVELVQRELVKLFNREKYDLVLLLLPSPDTHGHHQSVAQLALEVVADMQPQNRPAVVGTRTTTAETERRGRFSGLSGFPLTRTTSPEPAWTFDRRTPLKCHRALDYSIVVNWVIAEHKSQGSFQMEYGRRILEHFWLFEISGPSGAARWRAFLQKIAEAPRPWTAQEREFAKALRA